MARSHAFIAPDLSFPPGNPTDGFEFIAVIVGGFIAVIVVLLVVTLRRPLLAVVPASPEAVLRDLAYRLRSMGHPVKEAPDRVEVRVSSLASLKLHVRGTPRGTEVRYEVDATGLGWTIVLILGGFGASGVLAIAVALYIHITASGFVRDRVAPLLALAPLGTAPPPTVRSLLLEGLSEAQRLASEASEYEREAAQNAIGLILLGSLALFSVLFVTLGTGPLSTLPAGLALAGVVALGVSVASGVLGAWIVRERASPRVRELEQESALFGAALAAESLGYPVPGAPRPGLELLLRAAERSPYWREVRRRRKLWHDPVAGFVIFLLGYGAFGFLLIAAMDVLPLPMRVAVGLLGAGFAAGAAWSIRRWRAQVREEDERDRRSWDARRAALEAELWKILSG